MRDLSQVLEQKKMELESVRRGSRLATPFGVVTIQVGDLLLRFFGRLFN